MGSGSIAPLILNLDSTLGGGEWPMSLISEERQSLQSNKRLDDPRTGLDVDKRSLPILGIEHESSVVQPLT
jgi:hypothetical protein